MTIPEALEIAVQHHQAGRLTDAETLYRQILAAQPNHADALHLLGVIADQAGRHDAAAELIRRAIAANPAGLHYYLNLGNALLAQNQACEAIACYRRALQIHPDFAEAHNNLGHALRDRGEFEEAVAACRRALEIRPDFAEAHNNLGNACRGLGRLDEAMAAYRSAVRIKPDFAEAHNNLSNALRERGELDQAIAAARLALQIRPRFPEAHTNLANALRERGRIDEAIAAYQSALQIKANLPETHNNLGNALRDRGRLDEAVEAYRHALQLNPEDAEVRCNLGNALAEKGELDAAIACYLRALQFRPDYAPAHNNLGSAWKDRGELDEAVAAFRHALRLKPEDAAFHSNLIYTLQFHPGYDDGKINEEHDRWNRRFGEPLEQGITAWANDRAPERKLRIGYVSPDFYDQAECYFVIPLLEAHDHTAFEVHAYASVRFSDAITERFKRSVDFWHDVRGVSDSALAEQIRKDGIDVLIDLTMHMRDNRLPVFCRQPAPVQVSWLAYPGSTGLRRIGYRLTDAHMEPVGDDSGWSSEEPVRLPDSWCCYLPVGESPEVSGLPALSDGRITFGSLNNFCKVHPGVLARWARLLHAVEGARLLMRCPEGCARERIRTFFAAQGVAEERVELVGAMPRSDYLRLYHRIDIGLDPFPYNGITTTCDALWMGAPVLTLPGARAASRVGKSLLSSAGLAEFVADSEEDYLQIAQRLAGDLPRLAALRAALRPQMRASPLMDAQRFTRHVEAAYRTMWERWRVRTGLIAN